MKYSKQMKKQKAIYKSKKQESVRKKVKKLKGTQTEENFRQETPKQNQQQIPLHKIIKIRGKKPDHKQWKNKKPNSRPKTERS